MTGCGSGRDSLSFIKLGYEVTAMDASRERKGRYFHDLNEEKGKELFTKASLEIEKMWITKDVREGRVDELWLNIIARRRG